MPKKLKFKSAEAKRKHLELQASWEQLKRKYDVKPQSKNVSTSVYRPERVVPPRGESVHYPSRDSGGAGGTKSLTPMRYTGTAILGIGTLHKSNAVPIFSSEEAESIAKMRRG